MQLELTNPDKLPREERLPRLHRELKLLAEHMDAVCINLTAPHNHDFCCYVGLLSADYSCRDGSGLRTDFLQSVNVDMLVLPPKQFDPFDPEPPPRRYTFTKDGNAYLSFGDERHAPSEPLGSLGQGLEHLLDFLREILVEIRNETDEKIRSVMRLADSLAGRRPFEPRLGEK